MQAVQGPEPLRQAVPGAPNRVCLWHAAGARAHGLRVEGGGPMHRSPSHPSGHSFAIGDHEQDVEVEHGHPGAPDCAAPQGESLRLGVHPVPAEAVCVQLTTDVRRHSLAPSLARDQVAGKDTGCFKLSPPPRPENSLNLSRLPLPSAAARRRRHRRKRNSRLPGTRGSSRTPVLRAVATPTPLTPSALQPTPPTSATRRRPRR